MTPAYIVKLGLIPWKTSLKTQKIDDSIQETHGMALVNFLL